MLLYSSKQIWKCAFNRIYLHIMYHLLLMDLIKDTGGLHMACRLCVTGVDRVPIGVT